MASSVGELVLELGLDPTAYNEGMENAHKDAIAIGQEIEANLRIALPTLTPKVNDSALTKLNQHFDLKESHAKRLNRFFSQNPLKIKVDFSQLNQLERKLDKLERRRTTASISTQASGSSGGDSNSQLAEMIGKAVARNLRPGLASRATGLVGNILATPGRVAGRTLAGVAEGLMFGVTQEVSRNLGKGLSKAIENSLSGSVGSSELLGEKVGGAIAQSMGRSLSSKFKDLPDTLNKFVDELEIDSKLKRKFKQAIGEIEEFQKQSAELLTETLGGQPAIQQEALYQRGTQSRDRRRRVPATQEQAAEEWREALRSRDRVQALAATRTVKNNQQLQRLGGQYSNTQQQFSGLESQIRQAQQAGAPAEEIEGLTTQLRQTGARLQGLAQAMQSIVKYQQTVDKAVVEAQQRVKSGYQQVQALAPKPQPKTYMDLVRQVTGKELSPEKIPQLRIADASLKKSGALSQYDPARNAIEVTRKTYEAIENNTLTPQQVEMLKEELEHAVDFDFGSFRGLQAAKQSRVVGKPVVPTAEEFAAIAPGLAAYAPERRPLELNAKVKALRGMTAYEQESRQSLLLKNVPTLASNKEAIANQRKQFQVQLQQLGKVSALAGNDLSKALESYSGFFDSLQQKIEDAVEEMLSDIDGLDQSKVNSVVQKIQGYWKTVEGLNAKVNQQLSKQFDQVAVSENYDVWTGKLERSKNSGLSNQPLGTVDDKFLDPNFDPFAIDRPPVAIPLQLFMPEAELVPVQIQPKQSQVTASQTQGRGFAKPTQRAVDATNQAVKQVTQNAAQTAQAAIAEAQKLENAFSGLYKGLQDAIKKGDDQLVRAYSKELKDMAEGSRSAINTLIEQAKQSGETFGSDVLAKLGGVKGRLTQRFNLAQKGTSKYQKKRAAEGEDLTAQALDPEAVRATNKTLQAFKQSIQRSIGTLNQLTASLAGVEVQDTFGKTLQKAAVSERGKDLLVNTGGFVASNLASQHGLLPELGGDLIGALVTRQVVEAGIAGKDAYSKLQNDETFKAADALKKFSMILTEVTTKLQSSEFGEEQNGALFGDIVGFTVGNLVKELPKSIAPGLPGMGLLGQIPGRGALAASQAVPMLSKMRAQITQQLQADQYSGEELKAQRLNLSYKGLKPNKQMNDAERVFLEHIIELLDDAIVKARQFDLAFGMLDAPSMRQFEESLEGVNEALDSDGTKIVAQVQKTIADYERTVQELEKSYAERFQTSQDNIDETFRYREAYAELLGDGQDPQELDLAIAPPKPPSGDGFFGALRGDLDDIVKRLGGLKNAAGVAFKAIVGFAAASIVLPFFTELATSALDVATEMEGLERRFKFAYGSMAEGRSVIAEVRADANALGADLKQALEGRAQLAIASKGTAAQGEVASQTAEALTQAGAVYGVSSERQGNANLAVAQMFQKSVIGAEELRGQLAETGMGNPIQTMADAIGVDVAELNKMMERRELVIEEVFPKFAAQMMAETSVAVPDLATSSQSSINRFNNSMLTVQESIGKPLLPARNMGLEVAAKGMDLAADSAGTLVKMLGAVALTPVAKMLFDVAKSAIASAQGMTLAGFGAKTLNFSMKSLTSTAKFLKGALGAIALPLAIFTAIEVIGSFGKAFKDAGGEVREFADQGVKSLAEYDKALADLQNRSGRGVTPPEPPQLTGAQTEFGDTGGSLMDGPLGAYERWFQDQLSQGGVFSPLLRKAGIDQMPVRTYGQVEAEQRAIANEDFLYNTGETRERLLGEIQRYELNPNGEGLIAQVRGIDQQLEEAQGQRRALLPGDTEGRRALDKQIDELLQQREKPGQVLAQLRQLNLSKIEQLQQQIQAASAAGDTESLSRLQSELDATTNAVDKLNGLIGKTPDVLGRLARGFAEIQAELEKVNMELDRSAASNRKAIASAQISGATPGELEFARSLADQTNMRGRMNANESAIGQARNTLESSQETMDALKSVGINSVDEINPAALTGRIQNMEDSTQKSLIEQAIAQKQQIDSLTTQNFDLDAQIKESQAAAVEKLRSLANQVYDFFRGIEQSAKEVQINAQQTAQQIKTETAQSRLKGALMGFQDSFLNDFVNSLIAMVDALNKPLNDAIAAQQQILSAQNQYFQQIQQSFQLSQQLPSNQQVAALGGEQTAPSEAFSPLPAGLPVAPAGGQSGQGAMNPASQQSAAPLPAIPVGSTQMTAPEIQGQLGALAQLDPVSAQAFSQQGLAAAQAQAAQNYQTQVDAINQQLAASQQFAQLEAAMQADSANRALWEATRRIDDTSRGYRRSLEDLFAQGEVETPLTQIQSTFRGMAREFEDSMRGMEDFRRGLQQTVDQAEMLQQVIRDGVAQGIMPPEMLQMLPQIQQMSDAARDDLNELAGTMTDYEQAYEQAVRRQADEFKRQEGERRFQARQRQVGFDGQMYGARAQQARLAGDEGVARSLEYRAKYLETQNQYEGQFRELQELQRTGQITANEFERMAESLRGLNQISLRNLRTEVEKTNNEIASSALFGGSGQDMSRRDRRRVLREADEAFRLAASTGELNQSQQREYREAFNAVRSNQGASDQQLVNLANRFQDNSFFNQLMQMTGNGNITAIAGISEQTASTSMTGVSDQASSMIEAYRAANSGIEQRLDTLNSNLVRFAAGPRQLNVTTPDPIADTGRILNDLSNQQMKTAGI